MLMEEHQSVCSDLLDSLDKPEFCDIRIVSSDGEIPASKAILSIRSEYFCRMFSPDNNFVESSTGRCKLPYPRAVVIKVITYLYSGKLDVGDLALAQLLDLLELLNLMNLTQEFKEVESFAILKIEHFKLSFSECLKNLDKCSKMRMETLGETLVNHLGSGHHHWFQLKEIGVLSETMMVRLLQESKSRSSSAIIWRFQTFVTWLSANSMNADKKDEILETFDFKLFTVRELASVVRTSGLYSSDKIIARMEEICKENVDEMVSLEVQSRDKDDEIEALKEEMENKDFVIDHLEKELREEETILEFELSVKDQEIYRLEIEKSRIESSYKRKIADLTSHKKYSIHIPGSGKVRKLN